jgi:hypothetical protein
MKKNNTESDKSYRLSVLPFYKTENEEICLFTLH